jgi:hypothetical protein
MGSYLSTETVASPSYNVVQSGISDEERKEREKIFEEQIRMFNEYFGVKEDPIKLQKHHEEYFKIYKEYSDKYVNDKIVVLMLINDFYEIFETVDCKVGLDAILEITQLKINENSNADTYPSKKIRMTGFPKRCLPKFKNILLENKYTIIYAEFFYPDVSKTGNIECSVVDVEKPNTLSSSRDYFKIYTNKNDITYDMLKKKTNNCINVFVAMPSGVTLRCTDVDLLSSIYDLKLKIRHHYNATYPFYIKYHSRKLQNESLTIEECGIQNNHTIEVVRP